ncbi:Orn/Lys/Arg decarboxylase N-terminal domain-containing protein [Pasteurella skyensis]|uniref:Orn/Lys/Arg decarboxylase N-terminal domain-containing protein n=1 Tax=Phocoenobacter skyensis TaxID=97481 RepID=A0AAJ6NCM5_9PAST|nr:Orn/Lys/Arg decarboxylase N-terminal domain-containing protein [Pasteurella skyensis]MDP8170130.1 Orn/Lys/Arg decarboxylase N-terminal domain-containing protein [Pasteurella skyensis]MDP8174312.1 Orn/Lys/Arg decarboxylase N-terminal domain-containing protein [Pasteurella skyensis]
MKSTIDSIGKKILFVHRHLEHDGAAGRLVGNIVSELERQNVEVITAITYPEATGFALSDISINMFLIDLDTADKEGEVEELVNVIRKKNAKVPIFLCANHESASKLSAGILAKSDDFIWLMEDTPSFIAGRIIVAIDQYTSQLLPPMFKALVDFGNEHAYSWHTPGHTGGTGFLKHPTGRFFFDFFGENMFRTDLSISVGKLGSLLDHNGPIGDGEKYAATVFGSDRTYYVTNGSSTSNRIITMASVTKDEVLVCDRNCHKSIEHSLIMSHSVPSYIVPVRNGLGIIGPVLPESFSQESMEKALDNNVIVKQTGNRDIKHLVLTNSTYDGLCYDIAKIEEILGDRINTLHFDEAWYGYAKFHPMYKGRFAMHDRDPNAPKGPNVISTHSTHKLLNALSQASYIHIRDGKNPIEHDRFNESFMLHSSTSPNYAVIASCDVAAKMMEGESGKEIVQESIEEAVSFRQKLAELNEEFANKSDWFFKGWQPDAMHKIEKSELLESNKHWVLHPNQEWHGFGDVPEGWVMLDPIKVTVMTPGMDADGTMHETGIPACIVTRYLGRHGIQVEKTTDFGILFLFSMGITKGKWGTLISQLANFKRDYDNNAPLTEVLPELAEEAAYAGMGLKDLCNYMFATVKELQTTKYMSEGFSSLPKQAMTPAKAFEEMVRNNVEKCTLEQAAGRIAATGVIPYPPGIPILMPGEVADGAVLEYLKALEKFDLACPSFEHDTHGIEVEDGVCYMLCVKE